jgi:hypothetical protein
MEKPIVNPQIPYSGEIPGGLQQGKMVRIQGAVPQHADRLLYWKLNENLWLTS